MSASVSVIIVSYHTGPTLWLAIASVLQQPECLEVIVVDNGNLPGEKERLRALTVREPRVKLLSGHGNVGFGKGNNLGVAQAAGDHVLLLNPDSMLPAGALAALFLEVERYPENTLAGCYLINPDGSEQRGGRRALLTPLNGISESLGLNRFLKKSDNLNYHTIPMPEETHEVPAISGAFMFLSRSFYQRLRGFDEGYFLHMEDMDFCYRVHQAGGKVICVPGVKVIHFRSTSDVTSSFIEKHKAKGFVRYLQKHFATQHSPIFLKVVKAGIFLRLWLKIVMGKIDSLFVSPMEAKREIAALALLHGVIRLETQGGSLADRTIIVTGSATQTGMAAIGKALAAGARVIAVYADRHVLFSHPNLEWKQYKPGKKRDMSEFLIMRADILLHAEPLARLPDLLPALHPDLKRVVAFGTDLPPDEKQMNAEKEIIRVGQEQGRDVTILNLMMPYGVGLDDNITAIANVIKRYGFMAIYREGKGLRNPVQVKDAVEAAFATLEKPQTYNKIYNIGGGSNVTYREMCTKLFEYIGKPVKFIRIPFMPAILSALGKVYQLENLSAGVALRMNNDISFDNTAAIEDFNYRAHAFLDGDITV